MLVAQYKRIHICTCTHTQIYLEMHTYKITLAIIETHEHLHTYTLIPPIHVACTTLSHTLTQSSRYNPRAQAHYFAHKVRMYKCSWKFKIGNLK